MSDLAGYQRQSLSIDQQLALRTAASRLAEEFTGVYGPETIERFLHSSYDQFATGSTVPNFLPLLAERFARQRPRPVRDEIERRVRQLLDELAVPATHQDSL